MAGISSEETFNFGNQSIGELALMNETIGTMPAAFVGYRRAIQFGKDNHAQVRTGEADLQSCLQSVYPRHAEIEKHQVWLAGGCQLHCIQAITRSSYDLKPPGKFELITDGAERCGRIVGYKHTNRFRRGDHLQPNQINDIVLVFRRNGN
jgi:hypothetical protein